MIVSANIKRSLILIHKPITSSVKKKKQHNKKGSALYNKQLKNVKNVKKN